MLKEYMNQSLSWKHAASVNEYNESTYTTTTIKGRKETGHKLVKNAAGEDTVSSARVFTESAIIVDDLIDDTLIISVESAVDLGGTVQFYTGYLA